MKKSIMSLSAIIALSSLLSAGTYGNQYNTYDGVDTEIGMVVDVPEIVYEKNIEDEAYENVSGFYLGVGYSYISSTLNSSDTSYDNSSSSFLINYGYSFNEYIAIEGRETLISDLVLGDESVINGSDLWNSALYLKLSYPISNDFSVYGLAGFGYTVDVDSFYLSSSELSFQYGGGVSYRLSESFDLYTDYTSLYNDDRLDLSSFSFGLTYRF